MSLSPEEYRKATDEACVLCAKGYAPRERPDTGEWVHDVTDKKTSRFSHTLCTAGVFHKIYGPPDWLAKGK